MRDSDLDLQSEHPSEDEVLAPRVVESTLTGRTPAPVRRSRPQSSTTPLLVGSALALVVVLSACVMGVVLILGLWASG